jgi:LysR family hydrogen peroxide-inducible transcriptional activator
MEIQQIRYFVSIARELNFTRAAERCRVAQPSLSQQIQKLERELGGPLFHRLGRRIRLTDLGEALLPRAERMLLLHQETLHEASERAAKGGSVSFGAILTIAPYLMHLVTQRVQQELVIPNLEAHEDFTENLLKKLREGTLDFAIMSTPVEEPAMLCRVIATEPFVAVLPENHRLLDREQVLLSALLEEPFLPLSYIHCAGRQISEACLIDGKRPNANIQCTQIETILKMVEQGTGVTMLPHMALERLKGKTLQFRHLTGPAPKRDIAIVHHQDRYLSPSAMKLIQIVENAIREICPDRSLALQRGAKK